MVENNQIDNSPIAKQSNFVSATQDIVSAFTGAFDLDTLLQKIIEIFVISFDCDRGAVFIHEPDTQKIVMSAMYNYPPELRFNAYYSTNVGNNRKKIGLGTLAFVESKTIFLNSNNEINNHPSHSGIYVPEKDKYKGTDCNSLLCIPLIKNKSSSFGVLKLEKIVKKNHDNHFLNEDVENIEILVEIVSKSIKKFQEQSTRVIEAIHTILSKVLTSSTKKNLHDKLQEIIEAFKDVSQNANNISIWLKEDSKLVCQSAVGYSKELVGKTYNLTQNKHEIEIIKQGEKKIGLTPWIFISGKIVNIKTHKELVNHPQYVGTFNHILYPDNQDKFQDFSQSFIGVPLKIGEQTIGVIKADSSYEGKFFTNEEEQILINLSVVTAIIIARDKEFRLTQRRDTQLISLYELGTECYELETTDDILWLLLVGLTHGNGLGYNRAMLFKLVNDNSSINLKGHLSLGPRDKDDGKKIQQHFKNHEPNLKDAKNAIKKGHPTSELQLFIERQYLQITKGCELYNFVNQVIETKNSYAKLIEIDKCDQNLKQIMRERLETYNSYLMAFSVVESKGNVWLGICDNVYSDLTQHGKFTIDAANIFVKQISLALSRLSLEKSNEEIEEEAWQEFTKMTAHRIGTETGLMSVALDFIKRTLESENILVGTIGKDVNTLERSLSNLKKAVNDYNHLQKPPKIELNQKIKIGKILNDVKQNFEINQSLKSKPIKININCGYEIPIIYGDIDTITYSFKEIFENAFKAMPNGGEINVYSSILNSKDGDWLKIVISDTGAGIQDENLRKIFNKGVKFRDSGTGLGLHIVKRNIELNGGEVKAFNNISGRGASFSVSLPIRKSIIKKILIIEDNKDNLEQICRSINIKYPQIALTKAVNESEAIDLLNIALKNSNNHYDCIIADIDLKDEGGTEFGGLEILKFVNRKKVNTKFIIISANEGRIYKLTDGNRNTFQYAKDMGAFACISRTQEGNYLDDLNDAINA